MSSVVHINFSCFEDLSSNNQLLPVVVPGTPTQNHPNSYHSNIYFEKDLIMSPNNHISSNVVPASVTNNEMTLLMLQLRTLKQTKRISPSSVQPPVATSSQGIGRNIPLLLQRRRQYREQGGTHQRLPRTDLVKLMDEALSISTEITMVVEPLEAASVLVASSGIHKGITETHGSDATTGSARRP